MSSAIPGFTADLSMYQRGVRAQQRPTVLTSGRGDTAYITPQGACCEMTCDGLPWVSLSNCRCTWECEM